MPSYEFAIELTVPDNTAFTVLVALRGLGYAELARVERADILRLEVADGTLSRADCARALTRAEVVYNPNKHRLLSAEGTSDDGSRDVVVADKDDDTTALRELLKDHFGMQGITEIHRATAWRLFEKDRGAPTDRLDWACKALLANPNSQTYDVRERPAYKLVEAVDDVARRTSFGKSP